MKRSRTAVKFNYDGAKQKSCPHEGCTYTTDNQAHLNVHKRAHTGERPYPCKFEGCVYSATTQNHLKIHTLTHTGERPHPCPVEGCLYRATTLSNLKSHVSRGTNHKFNMDKLKLEEFPMDSSVPGGRKSLSHKCDYSGCNYETTHGGALTRHKKRHTHNHYTFDEPVGEFNMDELKLDESELEKFRMDSSVPFLPDVFKEDKYMGEEIPKISKSDAEKLVTSLVGDFF